MGNDTLYFKWINFVVQIQFYKFKKNRRTIIRTINDNKKQPRKHTAIFGLKKKVPAIFGSQTT